MRTLAASDDFADFTCGTRPGATEIDTYLHTQAQRDHTARLSAVWVALDNRAPDGVQQLMGCFTLSPLSIPISPTLTTLIHLPETPYPAAGGYLLGRLGVAAHQQGQRFGDVLVFSAIHLVRQIGGTTAGSFLAVDPKSDLLVAWYTRLGFVRLDPTPQKRRMVFRL